jgi:adenosylcobinamide kinase/adenosylcobinamide-phosphate guanylyltransferase
VFTFLIGGARSGKSWLGQRMIEDAVGVGGSVVVVVTAEAGDDEMADRILRHQDDRPHNWQTIEAPHALADAVEAVGADAALLLDCLTFWIANRVMADVPDLDVEAEAERLAGLLAGRTAPTVVVTNEVGQGIVPGDPLSRRFRDVHGRVNRIVADRATDAFLVIAGRTIALDRPF